MGVRGLVNDAVAKAGLEIRRKPTVLVRSDHELTLTMEYACAHLAAYRPGPVTVLQVGAFDGQTNDPVELPIRTFDWHAVLVEPQPGPFASLEKLHADNDRVQTFNVAITEWNGTRPMYLLEGDGLPDWADQAASFDREQLAVQQKSLPPTARVTEIEVQTMTFTSLLSQARTERVDVLQIDAEGYDYELLRMFDVPRYLPAIIGYEHQHLSRADRDAAAELLIGCGYRLAMTFGVGDTVAVLA